MALWLWDRLKGLLGSRRAAPSVGRIPPRVFTEAELADPLEALRSWIASGNNAPAPLAEARVAALESRYGIDIPDDFRRYLLTIAPLGDVWDDEGTTWWGLEHIRNVAEEYEHDIGASEIAGEAAAYLVFADYLVWCWAWAVCCSHGPNRGRIAFIGSPDGFVADNFSEFVREYLLNPREMAHKFPAAMGA